jgi:hypothetical protein
VEPHAGGDRRDVEHARDVAERQPLPGHEAEDLPVGVAQRRERGREARVADGLRWV